MLVSQMALELDASGPKYLAFGRKFSEPLIDSFEFAFPITVGHDPPNPAANRVNQA